VIPIIFQAIQNHNGEQCTSEASEGNNTLFIDFNISADNIKNDHISVWWL